jgi:hypothetical protein
MPKMDDATAARILTFCQGMSSDDMRHIKALTDTRGGPKFAQDENGDMEKKIVAFCNKAGISDDDARELLELVCPDSQFAGDDPSAGLPRPGGASQAADSAQERELAKFRKSHGLSEPRIKHVGYPGMTR